MILSPRWREPLANLISEASRLFLELTKRLPLPEKSADRLEAEPSEYA
jgi:hypothetical protein